MSSTTCTVLELEELPKIAIPNDRKSPDHKKELPEIQNGGRRLESSSFSLNQSHPSPEVGELPSPTTYAEIVQRWNNPRINTYRLVATFLGFFIMGANDAAVGLESYYDLSYTVVSLVFLSPIVGYSASALLSDKVHFTLGQRGVAIITALCHLTAYLVAALHPPFPVLVVFFSTAGFGNGLEDAAWNAWVGSMESVNQIYGILHGFFGAGATISPFIATSMITKANLPWFSYYYFMVGLAALELLISSTAFWKATGSEFRKRHPRTTKAQGARMKEALLQCPTAKITWLVTAFAFVYMGVEVTLGGWITTFMLRVRHSSPFASGMTATGFWLGMTLGRMILGFVTPRIGEKLSVYIYIPIIMGLQLLFWLVPQFYVSAVAVGLQGFFIGPIFPICFVAATKLLPRHLHVGALGFAAAIGGAGASAFPFMVGGLASKKGVAVLQPVVLAGLGGLFLIWMAVPKIDKKRD